MPDERHERDARCEGKPECSGSRCSEPSATQARMKQNLVGRFSEKVDFAKPNQHNLRNGPVNRQLAKYHPRLRVVLDTELPNRSP